MTDRATPKLPEPLLGPVVDTHCHMDIAFDSADQSHLVTPEQAIAQAAAAGVSHIIQVGCDVESSHWAAQAALDYTNVWATVALHPNEAARVEDLHGSLAVIRELAALPQVRGIGETGLDYFRTTPDKQHLQHESFRAHIDMCNEFGKPLIIHDRDAHEDVIATLLNYGAPEVVVFHCFSGDAEMAKVCVDNGWYTSISGVVTFNNAQSLRDAVVVMPSELLLVETDSPFLTPAPNRGMPNSSALMPYTVRTMAQVRSVSEIELCQQLFLNASKVFGPF